MIRKVETEPRISVTLGASVTQVEGFVGNFTTTVSTGATESTIRHGVAILATGARESKPTEYLYGEHPAVVTQLEMDELFRQNDMRIKRAGDVVFIQCVGSRDDNRPYCSKVCCTHAIQNALELKQRNPDTNVYILYRDIRTYGKREDLYRERTARRGVLFFRYDPEDKRVVTASDKRIAVSFSDPVLGQKVQVDADLLCLAAAIEARTNTGLAQFFKVSTDADGCCSKHTRSCGRWSSPPKAYSFAAWGHYPKPLEESIAQAQAATAKALTVMAKDHIMVGGIVSHIDPHRCSGCLGGASMSVHMPPLPSMPKSISPK